jgi:hypothetical protein
VIPDELSTESVTLMSQVGANLLSLLLPCFAKRLAHDIAAQSVTMDA